MAGVTALRDAARAAIFSSGGRGFVRFLAEGDALLVSDAPRRGEGDALLGALCAAGFTGEVRDGLLYITPGEDVLFALCARLLSEEALALDAGALRLMTETARLLWQPKDKVLAGLPSLRARIAVRLREGKRSGLHEAGRLLCGWLKENEQ